MSRYQHAPDDAPLYRVPAALGGKVWPAYRIWPETDSARMVVVLDVDGDLVRFFEDDLDVIKRPPGLQDWMIPLIAAAMKYEDEQGGEWVCFESELAALPTEVREYVKAWRRP